jgi:hypothetical protein
LAQSESSDLRGGGRKGLAQSGIGIVPCGGRLFGRDPESIGARETIKFSRVTQESSISLVANIRNNARYGREHAIKRRPAALFECGKNRCGIC